MERPCEPHLQPRPEVDGQVGHTQLAAKQAEEELDEGEQPAVGLRHDVHRALAKGTQHACVHGGARGRVRRGARPR